MHRSYRRHSNQYAPHICAANWSWKQLSYSCEQRKTVDRILHNVYTPHFINMSSRRMNINWKMRCVVPAKWSWGTKVCGVTATYLSIAEGQIRSKTKWRGKAECFKSSESSRPSLVCAMVKRSLVECLSVTVSQPMQRWRRRREREWGREGPIPFLYVLKIFKICWRVRYSQSWIIFFFSVSGIKGDSVVFIFRVYNYIYLFILGCY